MVVEGMKENQRQERSRIEVNMNQCVQEKKNIIEGIERRALGNMSILNLFSKVINGMVTYP